MYSIGQLAVKVGFSASAIRYYEKEGLLPPVARSRGCRVYDEAHVTRLKLVAAARRAGFGIAEIRQAVRRADREAGARSRVADIAGEKAAQISGQIGRLVAIQATLARARSCDCESLATCATLDALAGLRDRSNAPPKEVERPNDNPCP